MRQWLRATLLAAALPATAMGDAGSAAEPLPEPLTLEHAMALADAAHPDLQAAAADTDVARAQRDRAAAAYGFDLGINAEARWVDPAERAFEQTHNDSYAGLYLNKRLYDFGRTRAAVSAADARLVGRQLAYADTRLRHRLYVLERYLDVLLADLEFRVQDEAMAIAYVRLDRARDQHELGQLSDVGLLEFETRYQETRSGRIRTQARQRTSRVQLSEALSRPGQLSGTLAEPNLDLADGDLPELAELTSEILKNNPHLQAWRADTEAARERLQAARAVDRPVISGRAQVTEFARETGSTDPVTVGLLLEVPLYTGGRGAAERAQARAELQRSQAQTARAELELRQQLRNLWEEIQVLRASRDEAETRTDYRELYLDRSRALYEMEVSTDLGDAMVVSSDARLRQAELDYRLLLDWAQLNVLRGRPLFADATAPVAEEDDRP